jgi:hypothetical protein
MTGTRGQFLRDNAFLVASVLLPLVVVGFFLAAAAVPRWRVPPPGYDIVLRSAGTYDQTRPRVAVDFAVRHGRIEATVRALPAAAYPQVSSLFVFDHTTGGVRRIAVDLPQDIGENDPSRTFVVEALADRRAMAETTAPDGYELQTRTHNSPGIVGDLFGMRSYELRSVLVNKGRVVPLELPPPYEYQSAVNVIGWLEPREVR